MEAGHDQYVAAGASGSRPHHINDSGTRARTMPASSGGGWELGRDQGLVAELSEGVVGLAGELAGHRQRGPLAAQALSDLEVVGVVGGGGSRRGEWCNSARWLNC